MALVQLAGGYGVIAVEGKAREPFGEIVSHWNDTSGKRARLEDLCAEQRLDSTAVGELRYQLFHRTVSALIEARRYGAREALMLVHSFDGDDSSFEDYSAFAQALGLGEVQVDGVTESADFGEVTLRLGWVREP